MIGKYKIITLCGSTRFKDEFLKAQKELTLKGNIVISVGLFGHSGDDVVWNDGVKEILDDMHKRKIDMADEIFVINKNGYIGSSTRSEIKYAVNTGKKVRYLEYDLCQICDKALVNFMATYEDVKTTREYSQMLITIRNLIDIASATWRK